MAICYSAPLTLTSVRLPTNRSCSLLSDSRTPIRTSNSMHLESKQAIKFPVLAIRNLFSSENKKKNLFESVIVASSRRVEPETVTEETWEECVLKSDVPVLVEFWASWCGPCKMVHREIEEIAEEYAGKIKFYMLRADEEVQVAEKYGVKAVPIVMLFKNGEKESSVIGTMPKEIYISAIEKLLTP